MLTTVTVKTKETDRVRNVIYAALGVEAAPDGHADRVIRENLEELARKRYHPATAVLRDFLRFVLFFPLAIVTALIAVFGVLALLIAIAFAITAVLFIVPLAMVLLIFRGINLLSGLAKAGHNMKNRFKQAEVQSVLERVRQKQAQRPPGTPAPPRRAS